MTNRWVGLAIGLFLAACSGGSHADSGTTDSTPSDTPTGGDVVNPTDGSSPDGTMTDGAMTDGTTPNDVTNPTDTGGDASTTPLPLAKDLLKFCLFQSQCAATPTMPTGFGCFLDSYLFGYLDLIPNVYQPYIQRELQCADSATSCASFGQCVAGSLANYCTQNPGTMQTCVGTSVVDCATTYGGAPNVFDCATTGNTCQMGTSGKAFCSNGSTCTALADGGAPPSTCNGNSIIVCDSHTLTTATFDCNLGNPPGLCVAGPTGAVCLPTDAPSCTDSNMESCDGTKVVACIGNRSFGIDCGRLGGTCTTSTNDAGMTQYQCGDPGNASCSDGTMQCMGTHLQLCSFGSWVDVDCASIGFTTCSATADAGPFGSGASCVM